MNKTEELKQEIDDLICLQWRSKTMRNYVWNKINEYTQQVSIEFALSFDVDLLHELSPDDIWKKYDLWIN